MIPPPIEEIRKLRRTGGLTALFDVDGTLAPIAQTPDAAEIPPKTREYLLKLAARDDTDVGAVSGRPLAQVRAMLGTDVLWLAGTHGFERSLPGGELISLWTPEMMRTADLLEEDLDRSFGTVSGCLIERKGPMIAVHTRKVDEETAIEIERKLNEHRPAGMVLLKGRKVAEFRPEDSPTKFDAVRWMMEETGRDHALYAGDDTTDEDGFRALSPEDFPILIGGRESDGGAVATESTAARFLLPSTDALAEFIRELSGF